jgi:hypothetical protein
MLSNIIAVDAGKNMNLALSPTSRIRAFANRKSLQIKSDF